MRADALRAPKRGMGAVTFAPVVRRVGLPRVGGDLGLGERAGQALALLVHPELEVAARRAEVTVDAHEGVALAVAAVAPIAIRILVGCGKRAAQRFALLYESRPRFLGTVAAGASQCMRAALARARAASDDVDGAAGSSRAIEHRAAAAHDLDALDRFQRDRGKLRRFEIALGETQAVHEHQRVLVAGDAEAAQVELRVLRAGEITDLQQAVLGEDVAEIGRRALADVVSRDHGHAHRQVASRVGKACGGDDDDVVLRETNGYKKGGEETADETQHVNLPGVFPDA